MVRNKPCCVFNTTRLPKYRKKDESKMKSNQDWHFFSIAGEYYLYNCPKKQAVSISEAHYKSLQNNDAKTWEYYIRCFERFRTTPPKSLKRYYYELFLLVANDCNARCIYCFAGQGLYGKKSRLMDAATAQKAVDFFVKNVPQDAPIEIVFFGGEPLMAFNTIKETVLYVEKKYCDRQIRYSMTTNGYLLNEEIARFIGEKNIYITLSIDGNRMLQNQQRPLADNSDAYDKITKSLKLLKSSGVPLIARGTYYNYNYPLSRIYNDLLLMGFSEILIVPDFLHVKSSDEVLKLLNQIENFYQYCADYVENIMYDASSFPFVSIAQVFRLLYLAPFEYTYTCERGKTVLAIDPYGEVYPCQRLSSDPKEKITSIFLKSSDFRFRNDSDYQQSRTTDKCAKCWNRFSCSHGCQFNCKGMEASAYCVYAQKMVEISIALAAKMSNKQVAEAMRYGMITE